MPHPSTSASTAASTATPAPATPGGHYRWIICTLLFFATTINYMDRQVLAILEPEMNSHLKWWNKALYGDILFWFQAAYAAGYLFSGRLMDTIGVRLGYSLCVGFWSLAGMANAAVSTLTGFKVVRFGLGLAEGGNFPGAVKAVTEWFPRRERALATGIFNAGSNVGAIVTPILVPWVALRWGWRAALLITGALGFFWLLAWLAFYRPPSQHPRLTAAERAWIASDPPDPPAHVSWLKLLTHPQTWAFAVAMFLVSPVWWFYLNWIPAFFHDRFGLNLITLGPPLVGIYLMADVGSIGGGWISSALIKRGWSVNAARKMAMLACALCVVPVFASPYTTKWMAVFIVGLAAAAHQGFAANLFTLVSDTVPRKAVSSVVGIGGMAGAIGGMYSSKIIGQVLHLTHNDYRSLFLAASTMYLLALAIIHILLPRLQPMKLEVE